MAGVAGVEIEEAAALFEEARRLLAEGDAAQAVIRLENYLRDFRDDWEARLELARARASLGDEDQALAELEGLAAAEDPAPVVHWCLGALLGRRGQARDEAEAYGRAEGDAPPPILFNQLLAAAEKEDAGALKRLRDALGVAEPEGERRHWGDALAAQARGDSAAAAEAFRLASKAPTSGWEAPYNAARCLLEAEEHEACRAALEEARRRGGERWELSALEGSVHQASGDLAAARLALTRAVELAPEGEVLPAYNLGSVLLDAGEAAAAVTVLRKAAAAAPGDAELRLAHGRALFSAGEHAESAEVHARIVEDDPQHFRAWYNLAFSLERLGEDVRAREGYERAMALRPGHYKTINKLARLHLKGGDAEAAARVARRSLEQERDGNAEGHQILGQALVAQGNPLEAVDAFEECLRRDPSQPHVLRELAACRRRVEDPYGAKEAAKKAYALAPADADVLAELGLAYLELGNEQDLLKSKKAFQDGLAAHPDTPRLLAGLAQASARVDPPKEAVGHAKRAVKSKGGYRAYEALGTALARAGKHKDAVDAFKRCLTLHHGFAPAYDGIAAAYQALGDPERSAKYRGLAAEHRSRKGEALMKDLAGKVSLAGQPLSKLLERS